MKMQKKNRGGGGPVRDAGCMCKRRIDGGAGPRGQGGCIEVIVKFEEKSREEVRSGSLVGGCSRVGEWVDVNKELKVCENAKKKSGWYGDRGVGPGGGGGMG